MHVRTIRVLSWKSGMPDFYGHGSFLSLLERDVRLKRSYCDVSASVISTSIPVFEGAICGDDKAPHLRAVLFQHPFPLPCPLRRHIMVSLKTSLVVLMATRGGLQNHLQLSSVYSYD